MRGLSSLALVFHNPVHIYMQLQNNNLLNNWSVKDTKNLKLISFFMNFATLTTNFQV